MDWKEFGAKIADSAPMIGAALGTVVPGVGNAAGLAVGGAIKVLAGLFGLKSENPTAAELDAAIKADPEAALKLRIADQQFELERMKLENETLKIELTDVQNARQREIEIKKAGGSNATFYSIGWIITLSFFGTLSFLIFRPGEIPPGVRDIVNMMLGYLASNFTTVVQYFFGSSKGSADKQAFMAWLTRNEK